MISPFAMLDEPQTDEALSLISELTGEKPVPKQRVAGPVSAAHHTPLEPEDTGDFIKYYDDIMKASGLNKRHVDAIRHGVSTIESGGQYGLPKEVDRNGRVLNRNFGRYQFHEGDLGDIAKHYGAPAAEIPPAQAFTSGPQAKDLTEKWYAGYLGMWHDRLMASSPQYRNGDADFRAKALAAAQMGGNAAKWAAGDGSFKDGNGTPIGRWPAEVAKYLPRGQGAQDTQRGAQVASNNPALAMGYAPTDTDTKSMLAALNAGRPAGASGADGPAEPAEPNIQVAAGRGGGGGTSAGGPPASTTAPFGPSGMPLPPEQRIPPGLIPKRTPISPQQLGTAIMNPKTPYEHKVFLWQEYLKQFQPQIIDTPMGKVSVDPTTGQQYLMPAERETEVRTGSGATIKPTERKMIGPQGPYWERMPVVPQGQVPGAPPAPTVVPRPRSQAEPPAEPVPPNVGAVQPPIGTGTRVAALGAPMGMLSTAPPAGSRPALGPLGTPPPAPAETTVAQATQPGGKPLPAMPAPRNTGVDYGDPQLNQMTEADIAVKKQEHFNAKATDEAWKWYDDFMKNSRNIGSDISLIQEARHLVEDDSFYSGVGSQPVLLWKKLGAATGLGPEDSAAAMEGFHKVVQSVNLENLKISLGGMGQIRVAEIAMINESNANLNNSVAANRFLLDYANRVYQRVAAVSEKVNEYVDKYGGPSPELRTYIRKHFESQPLYTDKELAGYKARFKADPAFKGALGSTAPTAPTAKPPPKGF